MELLGLICNAYGSRLSYIDPAATSVLLSSLTAVFVAIAASAIIIWRKVKNKVKKVIKIDPNKNKEVEKDIVVSDDEVLNADNTVKDVAMQEVAASTSEQPTQQQETDSQEQKDN